MKTLITLIICLAFISCHSGERKCIVKRVNDGAKFSIYVLNEYNVGDTISADIQTFWQPVIVVKEVAKP
jgi:hypothetical protein